MKKLKELIENINLNSTQLANIMGISKSYVSKMMNERDFKITSPFYNKLKTSLIRSRKKELLQYFNCKIENIGLSFDNYFNFAYYDEFENYCKTYEGEIYVFSLSSNDICFIIKKIAKLLIFKDNLKINCFINKKDNICIYKLLESNIELFTKKIIKFYYIDDLLCKTTIFFRKDKLFFIDVFSKKRFIYSCNMTKDNLIYYDKIFKSLLEKSQIAKILIKKEYTDDIEQGINKALLHTNSATLLIENPHYSCMSKQLLSKILTYNKINQVTQNKLTKLVDSLSKVEHKLIIFRNNDLKYIDTKLSVSLSLFTQQIIKIPKDLYYEYLLELKYLIKNKIYKFSVLTNIIKRSITIYDNLIILYPRKYNINDNVIYINDDELVKTFKNQYKNDIKYAPINKDNIIKEMDEIMTNI